MEVIEEREELLDQLDILMDRLDELDEELGPETWYEKLVYVIVQLAMSFGFLIGAAITVVLWAVMVVILSPVLVVGLICSMGSKKRKQKDLEAKKEDEKVEAKTEG